MINENHEDPYQEIRQNYRKLITYAEAAEIARRSVKTLYGWKKRLVRFGVIVREGRNALLDRDLFIEYITRHAPRA